MASRSPAGSYSVVEPGGSQRQGERSEEVEKDREDQNACQGVIYL